MATRDTVPPRCNKPARVVFVGSGYRCCDTPGHSQGDPANGLGLVDVGAVGGGCDYPMDGKGAARYVKPAAK